jgi:heme exporter protein A
MQSVSALTTKQPVLYADGLFCLRDELPLFEPVSFAIHAGELLLIEGDNGIGKTTLLRALLGLRRFEAGRFGFADSTQVATHVSLRDTRWMGHVVGMKAELSVAENWRFFAALDGVHFDNTAAMNLCEKLGLIGFEHARVGTLSAGQKKRVQLGRLLLWPAKLWLMDEPFANLDRTGITLMVQQMQGFLTAGGAIMATSHGVLPFELAHQTLRLKRARSALPL